jgi:8-oxo-dGTP pyrophosphatase MutT (NUDIX family)
MLPYDPQRDEVVLIEQFRVGALGKTDNPWLIELVAGLIDKEEQPEEVAHREAQEEAGLVIGALWPMTKYFPSPGGSNEFVHLYLGRCETVPGRRPAWAGGRSRRYPRHGLGVSKMPCKPYATDELPTRPVSLPCNGWL